MKIRNNVKRILIGIVLVALLCVALNIPPVQVNADDVTPRDAISNVEIIDDDFNWRYLDDHTDPNVGTWYEEWNKRNGWAYPLDYLDWGTIPMRFSDETWSDGKAPFSVDEEDEATTTLTNKENGKIGSTYFFRGTFNLNNPSEIAAISGKLKYNDAAIVYINGKPINYLLNIPISNYSKNLEYGCSEKLSGAYEELDFVVEDVSSLLEGENVIAVEIHTSDEGDQDVYFDMESFVLNPSAESLPKTEKVKSVSVNVGEDENQLNFAWYALSETPGEIQIAKAVDQVGTTFPVDKAIKVNAKETAPAYTKFYDETYYYNKVSFDDVERGTDYIYRVGNDAAWSKVYPLSTQDISKGYEVLFISDPQIGTGTIPTDTHGWNNTLSLAFDKYPNVSFVANPGDMVDVANKESEYDGYFTPEYLASYPTATTVGNHDNAINYKYHFNEPNQSGIGGNVANSDYYYVYGNTLFMVLNANNLNNAEHAKFIEQTLEATKDKEIDWKVVTFHQSLYSAATQSVQEQTIQRREELVPILDKFEIDIALMGHDHCYVRSKHMKDFNVLEDKTYDDQGYEQNPDGILYLTMSSASGSKYYDIVKEYDYSAKQYQLYVPTFSHLTFTKDSFKMTAYRVDTMEVIDTYAMRKYNVEYDIALLSHMVDYGKQLPPTDSFNTALTKAQSVLADVSSQKPTLTQNDVDDSVKALVYASQEPAFVGNLETIKELVSIVEMYETKGREFLPDSFAVFKETLATARDIIDAQGGLSDSTLEIGNAWKALSKAFVDMERTPDKEELKALLAKAKVIKTQQYTDVSVKTLNEAITKAEGVVSNVNATQIDIVDATQTLQAAMDGLVLKNGSNPSTGDAVAQQMLMLLAILSITSAIIILRKRNRRA